MYCLMLNTATSAKSLQSCLTLCDPIDGSPPGSPVPGILQARTLEWVAISFSNAWKWKGKAKLVSHVRPSVTPWTGNQQRVFNGHRHFSFARWEPSWGGTVLMVASHLQCVLLNVYWSAHLKTVKMVSFLLCAFCELCALSRVRLFVTPWTVACQASLCMEFSRWENWSGLPFPLPRDLPSPGIQSLEAPALIRRFSTTASPGKPCVHVTKIKTLKQNHSPSTR